MAYYFDSMENPFNLLWIKVNLKGFSLYFYLHSENS